MDESIRGLLPDWVAGRLDAGEAEVVERAVARDRDLQAEVRVLRVLSAGRPVPPPGLADRIRAAVHEDRTARAGKRAVGQGRVPLLPWTLPSWGFAAAAAAIVALTGVLAVEGTRRVEDPVRTALESGASPWLFEDGMVAGVPVFEELSDETLAALLEELGG